MDSRKLGSIGIAALLLLSGCTAFQGGDTASPTATAESTATESEIAGTTTTAGETTAHVGCQPGEIEKDGTCQAVVSGGNAAIFAVENLTPITAERTTVDGTPGYLARPADDGTYPTVVLIHEWWGLNENIEHMADVLAGHGYVVFAVDLYDGEVATDSARAGELAGDVRNDPEEALAKMDRAVTALRAAPYTTDRVASLGWCFGGGQSLQLSLSDTELNATMIYYGSLTTDESELRNVDGPVLGIFGAEDDSIPVETVREFDRTLGELGVEREIHVYEGAPHAFANPSGERFHPEATRDAWNETLVFLDENLKE
ncbi:carboxymethylenebutenolidase [Halogranum amylolyticum]|uniref:Carboxymethylenebutenolidase n=1 Tax=Halogranum amylolyticum TaxID=660520 RepID=A0A1H8SLI0_9EURY|nr:dienelactone hydrolase family protein [Halogranum amylolyticum]SEO79491.1 carboxymethylenebutenolidase [Halogranum amylolyticum]